MKKRRPLLGTRIFIGLIVGSVLYKFIGFPTFAYYKFMFQHLPNYVVRINFILSIVLLISSVIVVIGVMLSKDFFRKLFIVFCVVTLFLSPFKYSYQTFYHIAMLSEGVRSDTAYPEGTILEDNAYPVFPKDVGSYKLQDPLFPVISRLLYIFVEVVFSLSAIIYFTRPRVVATFLPKKKHAK